METMKRRSILKFALLNIITFGIWGIIEGYQVGRDIDQLCDGDGETEVSYIKAWLLGIVTGGLYLEYWWYKQANRLKLNAGRYNLTIRESGLSMIAFRMWSSGLKTILMVIIGIIVVMSVISVGIASLTFGYYGGFGGSSLIFSLLFGGNWFFGLLRFIGFITPAWGIMGYIGLSFMFKNLNRLAEVYEGYEPLPFDPLGYEYYNADCNFISGSKKTEPQPLQKHDSKHDSKTDPNQGPDLTTMPTGHIKGISGTNKEYRFEVRDGEEIVIGKDPAEASIIVDPKYKEVSRKHCGISYIAATNEYQVIDYSVNGTFVNGKRLPVHMKTKVSPGTEITLGKTDNKFILE